ncbi:hypothetical protein C882_2952 [Caenispirillum salinarum AK4]|uniref:SPOR domain-containing protein n=1 Tax=Caenispirillum salinarum AK4 TaxID=1238182 RepID=K9HNH9_9PROT|nr:hypothetical protein [Caenispirillum salinarum]EKV31888.1 hypothetical protein C882_2952 [Caenispirillum salinarum AK4]
MRFRFLATAALVSLAATACAQRMDTPPSDLAGTWLVAGVYDSGTRLPSAQERQALENQAMRVSPEQITDPLGRNCPRPVYEIKGTSAADWFGFGNDWLRRRGPDVPLTAVTVYCDGAAFDGYALREDGALVGRYKDAYVVMRREDDPRVADRLAAVAEARYNRVLTPGASAAPAETAAETVVIGGPAADEKRAEGSTAEPPAPAPEEQTAALPPKEVLGPTRAELREMAGQTPAERQAEQTGGGGPVVHLASLRSRQAAEEEWQAIITRVPMLRDWTVRYLPVDLPEKGRYVRVMGLPPEGMTATEACARIEEAGQYCRVMGG